MKGMSGHLVCAVETCCDDFTYNIHKMLGFLYHVVYFAEGGRPPDRRLLHREL